MRREVVLLSLCCVVCALPAFAEPQLTGTPAELTEYLAGRPTLVKLVGTGEVRVQADEALVTIAVENEDRSLKTSLEANQKARADIIRALGQVGIGEDRITASRFSSTPKEGKLLSRSETYETRSVIRITVQSEGELQAIGTLVDERKDVTLESIDYQHSDEAALRDRALREACEDTMRKRKVYEEALGIKLSPVAIDDEESPAPELRAPVASGMDEFGRVGFTWNVVDIPPVFDELIFSADVRIGFRVQPEPGK